MCDIPINLVYEDELSGAVLSHLLSLTGRYTIGTPYRSGGFGWIKNRINGLNRAAQGMAWLVLTDLDRRECVPALIEEWFDGPLHSNMIFRVAVQEVEAWILGSREEFAGFAGISIDHIPQDVDSISDPKELLMDLIRRCRRRELKNDILPKAGSTAKVGPDYNGQLVHFVDNYWDPLKAQINSNSLERAIRVLNDFVPVFND